MKRAALVAILACLASAPDLAAGDREIWPISEFPEIQAAFAKKDYKAAIELALTTADAQNIPEMSARSGVINQHELFTPIINKWVVADPEAATAWALDIPGANKKPAVVEMKVSLQVSVGSSLVDRDPRRGAQFLLAARKTYSRGRLLEKAARLWAEKDLKQAAAWAEDIKHAEDRSLAVQGILGPWSKSDPAGAAAFAGQIEEDFRRHWELCGIAIEWAQTDPKKAAALTRTIEVADARSRAAKAVAARLTWIDPDEAFKLLEVIDKDGDRKAARINALWHWAEKEPEKALAMAEAIEHRPSRLAAVTAVWGGWSSLDPEKAATLVEEAKDVICCDKPQCRYLLRKKDVYYAIAGNWAAKDPEKTARWFRALPVELRTYVLRRSEPHIMAAWVPHHKRTREFKARVAGLAAPDSDLEQSP